MSYGKLQANPSGGSPESCNLAAFTLSITSTVRRPNFRAPILSQGATIWADASDMINLESVEHPKQHIMKINFLPYAVILPYSSLSHHTPPLPLSLFVAMILRNSINLLGDISLSYESFAWTRLYEKCEVVQRCCCLGKVKKLMKENSKRPHKEGSGNERQIMENSSSSSSFSSWIIRAQTVRPSSSHSY